MALSSGTVRAFTGRKCLRTLSNCIYLFCLKTGSCETTSGQRISFPAFSLADGIPLWYVCSGFVGSVLVLVAVLRGIGWS